MVVCCAQPCRAIFLLIAKGKAFRGLQAQFFATDWHRKCCVCVCVCLCTGLRTDWHRHVMFTFVSLTEIGKIVRMDFGLIVFWATSGCGQTEENCRVVMVKFPSWLNVCIPAHIENVMQDDASIKHLILVPKCVRICTSAESNNLAAVLNYHNKTHAAHTHARTQILPYFTSHSSWNNLSQQNIHGFRFTTKVPVSIWSWCHEILKMVILTQRWKEKLTFRIRLWFLSHPVSRLYM